MSFRSRTISLGHRLVVAMLGVALSSQLVQGQLLLHCTDTALPSSLEMQDPSAGEHLHHDPGTKANAATESDAEDSPAPAACVLRGLCGNAPAVPTLSIVDANPADQVPIGSDCIATPPGLTLTPDSPPPRV